MPTYTIRDLEKFSGIKVHTLRIWEQRYTLFKPDRTTSNIRQYCESELKFLLNISFLNKNGFKISKLAKLSQEEITSKVLQISSKINNPDNRINDLIISMLDLDRSRFERAFKEIKDIAGLEKTITDLIFPFLKRIGIMWQTGSINIAQEHFIINLIRQKIISAIDNFQSLSESRSPKYMLFLPEGEFHEIPLLYYSFLLHSAKREVLYMGPSIPLRDLERIYEDQKPENLVLAITGTFLKHKKYLENISRTFPSSKIFISFFNEVPDLKGKNLKIITDPSQLLS